MICCPGTAIIVTLGIWRACKQEQLEREEKVAIQLDSDEVPTQLIDDQPQLVFIVLNLPAFADGCGFTNLAFKAGNVLKSIG